MCLKSYFKEIVLKLATNGQSDKGFLLTSTFVPKGLSAPALGLYTRVVSEFFVKRTEHHSNQPTYSSSATYMGSWAGLSHCCL